MEEEGVVEFDVPLGFLPAVFPPGPGERKRAAGFSDGALMGAGEESEGLLVAVPLFGGHMDRNGRAMAFQGELGGWA